jgi:hypothetical protein
MMKIAQTEAVRDIRLVRGGSQARVMLCSNGEYYVVKFQNNPQGVRTLANEILGTLLADELGLPVPAVGIVKVPEALVQTSKELMICSGSRREPCHAGLSFGSRHVDSSVLIEPSGMRTVVTSLTGDLLHKVTNLSAFAGMLVLDQWTCNTDGRQVIFHQRGELNGYHATMIDNGFCFNATAWDFPDSARRGLYPQHAVYAGIRGIDSFEPWLSVIEERVNLSTLVRFAEIIPPEWYRNDIAALLRLLQALDRRRSRVRHLVLATLRAQPELFADKDRDRELLRAQVPEVPCEADQL